MSLLGLLGRGFGTAGTPPPPPPPVVDPLLLQVAEAVTYEINLGVYSQSVAAERFYQPRFNLADMETLHVSVVPRSISEKQLVAGTRFLRLWHRRRHPAAQPNGPADARCPDKTRRGNCRPAADQSAHRHAGRPAHGTEKRTGVRSRSPRRAAAVHQRAFGHVSGLEVSAPWPPWDLTRNSSSSIGRS